MEALGATVAALTPQIPKKNQEMIDKNELSFDLLHDAGNTYAEKLGLRFTVPSVAKNIYNQFGINSPGGSSDNSGTLPMPGRFVIDRGCIVRAVDVDPDYTRRPEPDKTIGDLEAI
ncbi:MAG: redoxin domain-containing protein [Pseudomonadota bacterium]|nr:redoxin domain-containing protein [Pseudomonadota bacterium]